MHKITRSSQINMSILLCVLFIPKVNKSCDTYVDRKVLHCTTVDINKSPKNGSCVMTIRRLAHNTHNDYRFIYVLCILYILLSIYFGCCSTSNLSIFMLLLFVYGDVILSTKWNAAFFFWLKHIDFAVDAKIIFSPIFFSFFDVSHLP